MENLKLPGTIKESNEVLFPLIADVKAQDERVKAGQEVMDEEKWKVWDAKMTDITTLKKHIQSLEAMEKLAQEKLFKDETEKPKPNEITKESVFKKYLRCQKLTEEEQIILEGQFCDLTDQRAVTDPQTVSTTGGGYLIPEGFSNQLEKAILPYASVLEACTIFDTASGNNLPWPTVNDTSNKGHLLTINTQDTVYNVTYGQVIFYSYMFTSYIVKVPLQLLQDSAFPYEGHVAGLLGERLGRILADYFTTGTGTSQPEGIVTGASNASVSSVSASAITRDNILDLKHSVNSLYRNAPGAAFMFNDNTFKTIAKLTFGTSDDRPLWQPNMTTGQPDLIEGKKYFINDSMADIGAAAKSMLFGDLKKFHVRRVLGTIFFVYREKYMDSLQIGYQAYNRWDSRMIDAGTHPVKYLLHSNT
jgi:HK97 family phage major capsid protein